MSQSDINIACNIILDNSPAFPVAFENSQSDQTNTHYQVTFIPVEIENIGVAFNSSQDITGIYQILLAIPLNTGKLDYVTASSDLLSRFYRGAALNYNSQIAEVEKIYEGDGFENDQWWVIPFSVEYRGFTNG